MKETTPRQIDVYVDRSGRAPFSEWLNGLEDQGARARIRLRLDRLSLGNLGDYKAVGDGVSELRIEYGPGYRVYFGEAKGRIVLLLCGGDKSTQRRDIGRARDYWTDYRSREDEK